MFGKNTGEFYAHLPKQSIPRQGTEMKILLNIFNDIRKQSIPRQGTEILGFTAIANGNGKQSTPRQGTEMKQDT